MLRSNGVLMSAAACATTAAEPRTVGLSASSVSLTHGPSWCAAMRCSSAMPMSVMTVFGSCWRRFILG